MSLKQKIFDYLAKRQPVRETRFPHMDRPLKILVIYESDVLERNDGIKTIRQDLLRRHMDVTMWGYVEKKQIQTLILPQSRILGLADYTVWGKPRDYVLKDLQAEQYDLLIDLTTHQVQALRYLVLFANAHFKAGLNLGEGIHDMLISLPDLDTENARPETSWLYNQIMGYLTSIQSMD